VRKCANGTHNGKVTIILTLFTRFALSRFRVLPQQSQNLVARVRRYF